MKYIYSTSQMSKLSLTLCTFSVTGSVAGLFLTSGYWSELKMIDLVSILFYFSFYFLLFFIEE